MNKNYMLTSAAARNLYSAVKDLPIIDYHCHLSAQEIYEDKQCGNIGELWLDGDHYKWRLMRCAGIDEKYITGDAPLKDKFAKYCSAIEFAAGNPLYHWSHMELSMCFDSNATITAENADEIWSKANAYIENTKMSPRKLIKQSNVEVICTTDEVIDELTWHKKLAEDDTLNVKVIPSFRTELLTIPRQTTALRQFCRAKA